MNTFDSERAARIEAKYSGAKVTQDKIYLGRAGAHPLPAAERDRIYEILLGYKEHPPVSRARHRRDVRKSKRR